jgi:hypothetical protein
MGSKDSPLRFGEEKIELPLSVSGRGWGRGY